jgi:hypothetical protein
MTRRIIAGTAATAAVLALWFSGPEPATDPDLGLKTVATVCEEDMSCWDCATMGNMVCGDVSVATYPRFAG